jgi:hypothetical protein
LDLQIETSRIPDLLANLLVEPLTLIQIGLAERIGVRAEREPAPVPVSQERRVVSVALRVESLCQQVLSDVLVDLLLVGHIAEALVETTGKKKQPTESIPVLMEGLLVVELVGVASVLVRPDVLYFERLLDLAGDVVLEAPGRVVRRPSRNGRRGTAGET